MVSLLKMDAQKRKKEFRAKLKQLSQKSRISSDIVRYNEHDQPVCRVCNVTLKSDSLWPAHQASKKHHEAIIVYKEKASKSNSTNNLKHMQTRELPVEKFGGSTMSHELEKDASLGVHKLKPLRALPADFFDTTESKTPKVGSGSPKPIVYNSSMMEQGTSAQAPILEGANGGKAGGLMHKSVPMETKHIEIKSNHTVGGAEAACMKGALPEGFFDNKDADLRARGIEPIKPNVKDKYKEFEKLIQEDLQDIDNRYEEEEIDAAEMIEEEEIVEQMSYKDRVEMLKRKRTELIDAKSCKSVSDSKVESVNYKKEESSTDDDDDDESFRVDWRAQHL